MSHEEETDLHLDLFCYIGMLLYLHTWRCIYWNAIMFIFYEIHLHIHIIILGPRIYIIILGPGKVQQANIFKYFSHCFSETCRPRWHGCHGNAGDWNWAGQGRTGCVWTLLTGAEGQWFGFVSKHLMIFLCAHFNRSLFSVWMWESFTVWQCL